MLLKGHCYLYEIEFLGQYLGFKVSCCGERTVFWWCQIILVSVAVNWLDASVWGLPPVSLGCPMSPRRAVALTVADLLEGLQIVGSSEEQTTWWSLGIFYHVPLSFFWNGKAHSVPLCVRHMRFVFFLIVTLKGLQIINCLSLRKVFQLIQSPSLTDYGVS